MADKTQSQVPDNRFDAVGVAADYWEDRDDASEGHLRAIQALAEGKAAPEVRGIDHAMAFARLGWPVGTPGTFEDARVVAQYGDRTRELLHAISNEQSS